MTTKVEEYLESAKAASPELAPQYAELQNLHKKKLWHQLTEKLLEFVALPVFKPGGNELIKLYEHFIRDFETKVNELKLAKIIVSISRQFTQSAEVVGFLEKAAEKVKNSKEAHAFCTAVLADIQLKAGQLTAAKDLLDKTGAELDTIAGAEPSVYSVFYRASADYYKVLVNPSEFYKNALLFLSYTQLETLSDQEKVAYAFDLGLAALVSESIYNFGELLAHSILESLNGTPLHWLSQLLFAFNKGDIKQFGQLTFTFKDQLAGQPALVANQQLLREKISVLSLLELVFRRPSHERNIPFTVIAEATQLPLNEVELLIIKSLSLKLIRGAIDQVDQSVNVTWVQPRVLDLSQITTMKDRLTQWVDQVHNNLLFLERETPELIV